MLNKSCTTQRHCNVALTVVALTLALSVAACGGGGAPSPSQTVNSPSPLPAPPPANLYGKYSQALMAAYDGAYGTQCSVTKDNGTTELNTPPNVFNAAAGTVTSGSLALNIAESKLSVAVAGSGAGAIDPSKALSVLSIGEASTGPFATISFGEGHKYFSSKLSPAIGGTSSCISTPSLGALLSPPTNSLVVQWTTGLSSQVKCDVVDLSNQALVSGGKIVTVSFAGVTITLDGKTFPLTTPNFESITALGPQFKYFAEYASPAQNLSFIRDETMGITSLTSTLPGFYYVCNK